MSRIAAACLALAVWAGCGPGESAADGDGRRTQPSRAELPGELAALLDSGTVAYRAGDYEAARRHYRAAAERSPDLASSWFGVYLAETALGNQEAAEAAMARFRQLGGSGDMHHVPHGDSVPEPEQGRPQASRTRPS